MKFSLRVFFCFCLALVCLLAVASCDFVGDMFGDDTTTDGPGPATMSQGLAYTLLADGTYEVSGIGTCTDTVLVIPAMYDGKAVTSIGEKAFYGCTSLTAVVIPSSVTSIGYYSFFWCTSLTSAAIPPSVTSIGDGAFESCTSLTAVEIPSSVTSIGANAFYGCANVIEVENGVSYVDSWVVDCDTSVTSVVLRANTVGICARAFSSCDSLTSITIPPSVKSIGDDPFRSCGL